MRYLIAAVFTTIVLSSAVAFADIDIDYFFSHDGGVFIHKSKDPLTAFQYLDIPVESPYGGMIHTVDLTRDGTLITILRGDSDNPGKLDLVKYCPNMGLTPLFGIITREELEDNIRIDRQFGSLNIDHSKGNIVFTVHEMTSKRGLPQDATYSSKIFSLPLVGGICENLGQIDSLVLDITAENGKIFALIQTDTEKRRSNRLCIMDESREWSFTDTPYEIEEIDSSPFTDKLLLKTYQPNQDNVITVIETTPDKIKHKDQNITKEFDIDSIAGNFKYCLNGTRILFKHVRELPWGDSKINFILSDNKITPLVRADLALSYSPIKALQTDASSVKLSSTTLVSLDENLNNQDLHICANTSNGPMTYATIDSDNMRISVLDSDLSKTIDYPKSGNQNHGIFIKDDSLFCVTSLELGEHLISFESIPYGLLDLIDSDGTVTSHNIHLAWNIGGRMLGILVPDKNMFTGSDSENIHLTLKHSFKGVFPTSEYVTPIYLMSFEDWMIEHPAFLGKINEMMQFIVRSFEDKSGNLYLLDSLNSEIIRFDSSRKKKTRIGWLPEFFPPLAHPTDMVLIEDVISILDPLNNRIVRFNSDGNPIEIINLEIQSINVDNTRFLELSADLVAILNETGNRRYIYSLN